METCRAAHPRGARHGSATQITGSPREELNHHLNPSTTTAAASVTLSPVPSAPSLPNPRFLAAAIRRAGAEVTRAGPGEMSAVPEELRCKRSDGKQWRCSAPSMPDKTVCEKHYVQAKKRSASSALRASLRRSSANVNAKAGGYPFPAAAAASSYADSRFRGDNSDADDAVPPPPALPMAVARPLYGRVPAEAVYVAEPVPVPLPAYDGLPLGNAASAPTAAELDGRGSTTWLPGGGAAGTASCHQCREVEDVIWCILAATGEGTALAASPNGIRTFP